VLSGLGALWMPKAQGQLVIGFGLVLMGVYAAYFRPRRRLVGLLVLMLTSYGTALLLAPRLPSPLFFLVVAGTVIGVALRIASMAARKRDLAFRDSLTGVLKLIDLDGFKAFNDAHGHLAGDDILVELTTAWKSGLRSGDIMARFGGDEFAVVLPESTPADARELAARLRALHPGAWSVGFAGWQPGEELTVALTRADRALYADKRVRAEA
jgi:diguanylate cyclase (GGDEF)-like protein